MNWKIKLQKLFTVLTIITLFCMKTNAQETKEVSEEVKRLQEQAEILKLEKEISEYQKNIFENNIAKQKAFDITLPKGEVSVTGEHIEAKLLSSKALSSAMSNMVNKLNKTINPNLIDGEQNRITLIYYDNIQLNKINEYKALVEELSQKIKDVEVHVTEAQDILDAEALSFGSGLSLTGLAISAGGVLNAIAGISSYFKTDISYTTFKSEYDDKDLISSFFQIISNDSNNIDFYAPNLYPIVSSIGVKNTPLSDKIKELNKLTSKIVNLITELDKQTNKLTVLLKDEKDKDKIDQINKALKLVENTKNKINSDKASIETIFKALYVQNDGKSNLSNILSVEALYDLLSKENSYVILLKASGTGGTLHKKGLFVKNRLEHSGGVTLNCIVFNQNSKVVFAGVERGYLPYSKTTNAKID
ncbi:MAG: hypothetical protein ACKV1O_05530 [Saprospiraceae bacterium]